MRISAIYGDEAFYLRIEFDKAERRIEVSEAVANTSPEHKDLPE